MAGILNEVMIEVGKVRNGGNLGTKWRNKVRREREGGEKKEEGGERGEEEVGKEK